jgi:hypothetical protein
MASYTVTRISPPSTPAQDDRVKAADTDEVATPFEAWLGEDGDPDDPENILAFVMEHIGAEIDALKKERDEIEVRSTKDTNRKIAAVLRQQREARTVESAALAARLDRMAGQIAAVTRENSQLRTTLENCEQNLRQATGMLEKEIARERSLRRLLDAQRNRPHTQRVASELAKQHAAKALEVATKGSKEEAA